MSKDFDLLALGEVLLRLSPPGDERLTRVQTLNQQVGGAECNVLAGVSLLGLRTGIISKLPDNALGKFAKNRIRFLGVSDDYLTYDDADDARLGIYFYETGAYPRKPQVVYDRKHTSMERIRPTDFPERIYSHTRAFHTSGITLAINESARSCAIEMIKHFKASKALISFDVNFRGNLWSGDEARECIEELLPFVDIFFCSIETARLTFNKTGSDEEIMKSFTEEYPISVVCSTKRTVKSPKRHDFTSKIYSAKNDLFYEESAYENIDVVDRIGSGDSYVAGVLYGLLSEPDDYMRALEYGNAYSAVKNTVPGDLPSSDKEEIDAVIAMHKGLDGGLEMKR